MTHLVQCMSSATTILSLFDLYRRTFGDGHVVLSLAYSVYTAASIFLLEIQALKYAAPGTLDKLKYCVFALERVKVANPGKFYLAKMFPSVYSTKRHSDQYGPQPDLSGTTETPNRHPHHRASTATIPIPRFFPEQSSSPPPSSTTTFPPCLPLATPPWNASRHPVPRFNTKHARILLSATPRGFRPPTAASAHHALPGLEPAGPGPGSDVHSPPGRDARRGAEPGRHGHVRHHARGV